MSIPSRSHCVRLQGAFTLVELLAVLAVIGVFVGMIGFAFMEGGSSSLGLQSAQTTLVSLLNLARSHAAMSGNDTGVFLQIAEGTAGARDTAHRMFVVAEEVGSTWRAIDAPVRLPTGCYALKNEVPTGWPSYLDSSAFPPSNTEVIEGTESELRWAGVIYSPRGSVSTQGRIVLCTGRPLPPNESEPVEFTDPVNVCGVRIYHSGLVRVIDGQNGFRDANDN